MWIDHDGEDGISVKTCVLLACEDCCRQPRTQIVLWMRPVLRDLNHASTRFLWFRDSWYAERSLILINSAVLQAVVSPVEQMPIEEPTLQ